MKTILITFLSLLLLITINRDLKSQICPGDFKCSILDAGVPYLSPSNPFQGLIKPNRTDLSGGLPAPSDSHFPVLVVFVQFLNEAGTPDGKWQTNEPPEYLDKLIAVDKNDAGNWWNFYNNETEMLSSHWIEISRGKLHVIGDAYSVVLPMTAQQYWTASNYNNRVAEKMVNQDIWNNLIQQGLVDWQRYDRWKVVNDVFYFTPEGQGDGFVDMIYKIHKSTGGFLWPAAGYNSLGGWSEIDYYDIVDPEHDIKIKYQSTNISGITLSFPGTIIEYIGGLGHEHGHHLFMGGHITYSRDSYGVGFDGFYSPYDMVLNEYITPQSAVFGGPNYLGDYSSRNSGDGELIKVPIQGNEFFLIANRTKVSKWDRVMLGDTSMYNFYVDNSDYGKGLYIYHIKNGINLFSINNDPVPQDMECADGFWNWEHTGFGTVYEKCWTGSGFYFFDKTTVNYDNDESLLNTLNLTGDGLSLHYYLYTTPPPENKKVSTPKRLDWGKIAIDNCHIGTTQFHTNATEWYTDFEHKGDRWDAWDVDYNEMFSPYSSPSTNTWNTNPTNQNSGIFIYYREDNGGDAVIDIYRAQEYGGNEPLSEILEATPPSRPMGLKVEYITYQDVCRPKLTWNHNMEPDMLRYNHGNMKKYEIWKASEPNLNTVPYNYNLLEVVERHVSETPFYIDVTTIGFPCYDGPLGEATTYPVRYQIIAVDNGYTVAEKKSVPSNFAMAFGVVPGSGNGEEPDGPLSNSNLPNEYKLYQNYPNPFNPKTNIIYHLPKESFVSIKVYDVTGKEIAVLVNEYKVGGSHIISFNGKELSSGVYYYKLEAGTFSDIKRMVLVK